MEMAVAVNDERIVKVEEKLDHGMDSSIERFGVPMMMVLKAPRLHDSDLFWQAFHALLPASGIPVPLRTDDHISVGEDKPFSYPHFIPGKAVCLSIKVNSSSTFMPNNTTMSDIEVYKFGGASVRDAVAIRNAGEILKSTQSGPLVVVISAMGKMTNHLESVIKAHYEDPDALAEKVTLLRQFHEDIVKELLGDQAGECLHDLHDLWVELDWILEEEPHADYNYHYDQIIVFGELASTKIFSAYLNTIGIQHEWLDARGLIKTDSAYREARVLWDKTQNAVDMILKKSLAATGLVITQGFIGSTIYNQSTSLGREGSDYTAAILAFALDARMVTIWKDVPGIMTGDPKRFDFATTLPELSYLEAIEMTYYGAKVIHPKTLQPLQNKKIPLRVRPFDFPAASGTQIHETEVMPSHPIVVAESNQVLLRISTRDFSFVAEDHLREIFTVVADLRIKVNSMRNTAISFMLCITHDPQKIRQLIEALSPQYDIKVIEKLELITVRHADEAILAKLKSGKEILFEEQYGKTDQFIVKE
jgi:aspartate kinase